MFGCLKAAAALRPTPAPPYAALLTFSGAKHCVRTGGSVLCRGADGPRPGAGQSATWYRGWRSLPDGRTVRAYVGAAKVTGGA
jgi:hypothetical protein